MPEPVPLSNASSPPRFLIGRDCRGRWVAQDERGLCGGLFVSRVEAVRFAMRETGRRPRAVIMAAGLLELDMAGGRSADRPTELSAGRRAA
jgi:hypothetical protein